MSKVKYEIIVNKNVTKNSKSYSYRYGFASSVDIKIDNGCGEIIFESSAEKAPSEFINSNIVIDAQKKIHLLHVVLFDSDIEVKKITLKVDGMPTVYDKETPYFPFVCSMLDGQKLGLNNALKCLDNDILNIQKNAFEMHFSAIYSFILGRSRKFVIDRFTNYWIAVNSIINIIVAKYKAWAPAKGRKPKKRIDSDTVGVGMMIWLIDNGIYQDYSIKVAETKWKELDYATENAIHKLTDAQKKTMFEDSLKMMNDDSYLPEYLVDLNNCAKTFEIPLFPFLMFTYPYYCRCKFLHGDRKVLLFESYNNYKIQIFELINMYLEKYLLETLPKIFKDEFFSDAMFESIAKYEDLHVKD